MGRARLTRIDAVREMAAAVDVFRAEALATLEGLDMDIRRALEWIHHDRHEHWDHEVRRGWDRITQARLQLQQARTARRIGDHDPACPDEKKALAQAQKRLTTAQEKVESVRRCTRAIDEAVNDYRGARTPLASWLESEAFKAIAALKRMMDNLDTYVAMQAPSGGAASAGLIASKVENTIVESPLTASGGSRSDSNLPPPDAVRGLSENINKLVSSSGNDDPPSPEERTTNREGGAA